MKAIIASDIHGNSYYCEKLYKLIELEKVDKIILLGDLLYDYHNNDIESVNEVINMLNKYAKITISVLGNCDSSYDISRLLFSANKEIEEIYLDSNKFYIIHGHNLYKYSYLLDNNNYLYGHTHVYNMSGNGINPGSVSYPRMNKYHTCIIYENNVFKLIDIETYQVLETKTI